MVVILWLLIPWFLLYFMITISRSLARRLLPHAQRVRITRLLSYLDGLDETTAHPAAFGDNSLPRQIAKGAFLLLSLGLLQLTYPQANNRTRVSWIIGFVVVGTSILISLCQFLFGQLPWIRRYANTAFALKILGAVVWCVTIGVVHAPYFMWIQFAIFPIALWFEILRGLRGPRKVSRNSKLESGTGITSVTIAILEAQRLMQNGPEEILEEDTQIDLASSSREQLRETEDQTAIFLYEPPHLLAQGTSLPCPQDQMKEKQMFPGFVRCTCCVSASELPKPEVIRTGPSVSLGYTFLSWKAKRRRSKREAFIRSPVNSPAQEFAAEVAQLNFPPHGICSRCQNVCNHSKLLERKFWATQGAFKVDNSELFALWNTPSELAQSAGNSCHLCTLIWTSLNQEQQETLVRSDKIVQQEMEEMIRYIGSDERRLSRLREQFRRRRLIWLRLRLVEEVTDAFPRPLRREIIPHFGCFKVPRLWLSAVRGYAIREMKVGVEAMEPLRIISYPGFGPILQPVASSTGSDTALAMIKKWLHLRSRDNARIESELPERQYDARYYWVYPWNPAKSEGELQGFVPTRLLDLGSAVTPDIRLVNGTDLLQKTPEGVEYVALSYCWGHGDFARLTKAKEQQFQEKISLASLGQTIQDAIISTRQLGFRYLWVDALCILQDSTEDWNIESISMCDVYNNVVCTIAAVKSWAASESMIAEQNPLATTPCLLSAIDWPWYAEPKRSTVKMSWQRDITMSRWNSRGWCYQEMALSKIIIFFGSSQVHASVREPHHHGWRRFSTTSTPNNYHHKVESWLELEQAWENLEVEKITAESYFSRVWWDHVAEYSPRNLTKAADKMVAISGIAEYLWKSGLKSHYIAGLWEDTLPRDLLWYVSARIRQRRPHGPRGPSWSWTSVDGAISHDSPECWNLNCGLEFQGISFNGGHGAERIESGKGIVGDRRTTTANPAEIAIPMEDLTPPRSSLRNRPILLRGFAQGTMRLHIRGKLQRAIWRPHTADTTDCFYRRRTAQWRYTSDVRRNEVEYHLTRPEGRPFHFEYYQDFNYLQTTTDNSSDGPKTFALLTANSDDTKEVGWFIPDVSEGVPDKIYCLQIKVEPETDEGRMNPFSLWLNRGIAVVPADESDNSLEYRRVGYIELFCEAPRLRYPTIVGFGRRGIEPSREPLNIDPHNFFSGVEEREITLI